MQLLMTVTIPYSRLLYEYTTVDKRDVADVLRLLVVCTVH